MIFVIIISKRNTTALLRAILDNAILITGKQLFTLLPTVDIHFNNQPYKYSTKNNYIKLVITF